jgi:hypothetical protein
MKIIMSTEQLNSINDLERFADGVQKAAFAILGSKQEKYKWIQTNLIKFNYYSLNKNSKGIVVQYLHKITGYSRQQITRLIKQYKKTGKIFYHHKSTAGFQIKYLKEDALSLVAIDELHGTLNGMATKKLCERAWNIYQEKKYERLATISVSHLYNLRSSNAYKRQRVLLEKTKPITSKIGERRKPNPNGMPGYLRVDTVHQGDHDGKKGVYHINAVDETTQFEVVCTVEKISEQYLRPILEYILEAFPFKILGFHSDNGSEYVNRAVAKLLNKLLIEFTKSRARKSNDNGLVESKNSSIVRKTFGYIHIPQKFANIINAFNKTHLNYYLNYHRPCLFASIEIDPKGKEVKKYKYEDIYTPYEKFKSLPNATQYLKEGITFEELDYKANMISDGEAARQMNIALRKLFGVIFKDKERNGLVEHMAA